MHFSKAALLKVLAGSLLALCTSGCAATYIPVTWGMRDQVRKVAAEDLMLTILFERCDPKRDTLRFKGDSFNEVMMPSEVKYHLGAYRPDTGLIYRNMEYTPNEKQLRDLIVHELAHHCWSTKLSKEQRTAWEVHLLQNPTPLQDMVRRVYPDPASYQTEDFAYTVEQARPADIRALVAIEAISEAEGKSLLQSLGSAHATQQAHLENTVTTQTTPGKVQSSP